MLLLFWLLHLQAIWQFEMRKKMGLLDYEVTKCGVGALLNDLVWLSEMKFLLGFLNLLYYISAPLCFNIWMLHFNKHFPLNSFNLICSFHLKARVLLKKSCFCFLSVSTISVQCMVIEVQSRPCVMRLLIMNSWWSNFDLFCFSV